MEQNFPSGCVFQQNNAPAHCAKCAKKYFMDAGITEMEWSARSPDLNCIDNAWEELTNRPYEGGSQFDAVKDLHEALLYE